MLIDFSFANFRSFRNEQSFSMSRDARFRGEREPEYSSIAAVYGSNASGKSNFLKALRIMCGMVVNSYGQGDASSLIPRDPFVLTESAREKDSMFFAEFIADDAQRYQYWFRFDDRRILEEELQVYKRIGERFSTHSSLLFSRDGDEVKFGASFKGPKAQVSKTLELRPNALALSAAAAAGIASVCPAFEFFSKGIAYCEADGFAQEESRILDEFNNKTEFSKHLSELIRYADFGISGVRSAPVNVPAEMVDQIKASMKEQFGADDEHLDQVFGSHSAMQLQFEHAGGATKADFGSVNESKGTLAALSFFSLALRQLSRQSVTLVDEIDTSLHPTLVGELVALYADSDTNPHGSQLIFTTHDVSLINRSGSAARLIQPDQVWLVEKNHEGASEIFPATDLKVRKAENIGKNYLNGVYGAVPKLSFHNAFARMVNGADA